MFFNLFQVSEPLKNYLAEPSTYLRILTEPRVKNIALAGYTKAQIYWKKINFFNFTKSVSYLDFTWDI